MTDESCVCGTTPYIHVGADGSHLCVLPRSHGGSCWAPCGGPMHTGNEAAPTADCNPAAEEAS